MKKRRICTTISAKHWELLKKYAEKFETQQKALEFALESLEKCGRQIQPLTPEEEQWMRAGREMKTVCVLHKDLLKALLETADFEKIKEVVNNQKPAELAPSPTHVISTQLNSSDTYFK